MAVAIKSNCNATGLAPTEQGQMKTYISNWFCTRKMLDKKPSLLIQSCSSAHLTLWFIQQTPCWCCMIYHGCSSAHLTVIHTADTMLVLHDIPWLFQCSPYTVIHTADTMLVLHDIPWLFQCSPYSDSYSRHHVGVAWYTMAVPGLTLHWFIQQTPCWCCMIYHGCSRAHLTLIHTADTMLVLHDIPWLFQCSPYTVIHTADTMLVLHDIPWLFQCSPYSDSYSRHHVGVAWYTMAVPGLTLHWFIQQTPCWCCMIYHGCSSAHLTLIHTADTMLVLHDIPWLFQGSPYTDSYSRHHVGIAWYTMAVPGPPDSYSRHHVGVAWYTMAVPAHLTLWFIQQTPYWCCMIHHGCSSAHLTLWFIQQTPCWCCMIYHGCSSAHLTLWFIQQTPCWCCMIYHGCSSAHLTVIHTADTMLVLHDIPWLFQCSPYTDSYSRHHVGVAWYTMAVPVLTLHCDSYSRHHVGVAWYTMAVPVLTLHWFIQQTPCWCCMIYHGCSRAHLTLIHTADTMLVLHDIPWLFQGSPYTDSYSRHHVGVAWYTMAVPVLTLHWFIQQTPCWCCMIYHGCSRAHLTLIHTADTMLVLHDIPWLFQGSPYIDSYSRHHVGVAWYTMAVPVLTLHCDSYSRHHVGVAWYTMAVPVLTLQWFIQQTPCWCCMIYHGWGLTLQHTADTMLVLHDIPWLFQCSPYTDSYSRHHVGVAWYTMAVPGLTLHWFIQQTPCWCCMIYHGCSRAHLTLIHTADTMLVLHDIPWLFQGSPYTVIHTADTILVLHDTPWLFQCSPYTVIHTTDTMLVLHDIPWLFQCSPYTVIHTADTMLVLHDIPWLFQCSPYTDSYSRHHVGVAWYTMAVPGLTLHCDSYSRHHVGVAWYTMAVPGLTLHWFIQQTPCWCCMIYHGCSRAHLTLIHTADTMLVLHDIPWLFQGSPYMWFIQQTPCWCCMIYHGCSRAHLTLIHTADTMLVLHDIPWLFQAHLTVIHTADTMLVLHDIPWLFQFTSHDSYSRHHVGVAWYTMAVPGLTLHWFIQQTPCWCCMIYHGCSRAHLTLIHTADTMLVLHDIPWLFQGSPYTDSYSRHHVGIAWYTMAVPGLTLHWFIQQTPCWCCMIYHGCSRAHLTLIHTADTMLVLHDIPWLFQGSPYTDSYSRHHVGVAWYTMAVPGLTLHWFIQQTPCWYCMIYHGCSRAHLTLIHTADTMLVLHDIPWLFQCSPYTDSYSRHHVGVAWYTMAVPVLTSHCDSS